MKKEILIDGRRVTYFEEGQGFTFLVIHGWGARSIDYFLRFQRILADRGYRVILLNLPGFEENGNGNGDPPPEWGMQDYLNCISGFINALGLEEFFLVGHSMGGAIAVRLAVSHPERVKVLILLSPGIFRSSRSRFWEWWLFLSGLNVFLAVVWFMNFTLSFMSQTLRTLKESLSGKAIEWLKHGVAKELNRVNTWLANFEPSHRFFFRKGKITSKILKRIAAIENTIFYLSKISQPTIIFWGERDYNRYMPDSSSVKLIPNHEIHVIFGVGHNLHKDAPEKIVELTVDFIKKQEFLD